MVIVQKYYNKKIIAIVLIFNVQHITEILVNLKLFKFCLNTFKILILVSAHAILLS